MFDWKIECWYLNFVFSKIELGRKKLKNAPPTRLPYMQGKESSNSSFYCKSYSQGGFQVLHEFQNFWFLVGTLNGTKTTFSYNLFSLILNLVLPPPRPQNYILFRSTGKHPKRTLEWKHFFVEISNFCFAKVPGYFWITELQWKIYQQNRSVWTEPNASTGFSKFVDLS